MKKISIYILILFTLIAFFIPVVSVKAQIIRGTCYSKDATGKPVVYYGWEEQSCKNNNSNAVWEPSDAPKGTCTLPNGSKNDGWTAKACELSSGTWAGEGSNLYNFLAPLPCAEGVPGCVGGKLITFDPTSKKGETNTNLGKYLNIMIRIVIGLCAVIAVAMMVIGGIQYMTSELMHSKEDGKDKMTGAIFGLIIVLGSYALLYTINPDLLKSDVEIQDVTVYSDLSEVVESDIGKTLPTGPLAQCSAGMKKTSNGMFACGDIVQNIDKMITDAEKEGIKLSGGGYRSLEEQKALRIKNCKGDFTNPSAPCTPPTGIPGQSNHNNGKAFDLRCDGVVIQTRDNKCFRWLATNANKYGLANLPSEPWHWSVDGR